MSVAPISASSFFTQDGDSLNDPSNLLPYGQLDNTFAQIDSFYGKKGLRRPGRVNFSLTGSTTTDMFNRRTNIALNATTHYFGAGGINDIQLAIPLATSQGNVSGIITFANAQPGFKGGIWIGPFCLGELQPDGANTFDAQIRAWDAAISVIVNSFAGWAYYSTRNGIWIPQEPIFNVPGPPGVASGILCAPNGGPAFGIHMNQTGKKFVAPNVLPLLTLT